MSTDQTESKLAYLSISKAKANNFRDRQIKYRNQMKSCKRKIKNIWENKM